MEKTPPSAPNNGEPLSGTWKGTWPVTTLDETTNCIDIKTIVITQVGNTFSGEGSFVAVPPLEEGCVPDGKFAVIDGAIEGNSVSMVWDFRDGASAPGIGTINDEKTEMQMHFIEGDDTGPYASGDITFVKQ